MSVEPVPAIKIKTVIGNEIQNQLDELPESEGSK